MVATPVQIPVNKTIAISPNGGSFVPFSGIKGTDGTLTDFSTGWTFQTYIQGSTSAGPNWPGQISSGSVVSGATGGVVNLQEPAGGSAGIADSLPTSSGSYMVLGSTDTFTTSTMLSYGGVSFLNLPNITP